MSDTVQQSMLETRSRNKQAIATSVSFAFLIVSVSFLSYILLNGLIETGSTLLESIKEEEKDDEKEKKSFFFCKY